MAGALPAAAAAPQGGPTALRGRALVLAGMALALANFVVVLDITITNVSVPHIAGSLAVSPSQGTWSITSYSVAEAISVPLTGWLAARFGAVRVFLAGMIGFGLCSMLCGLSQTLPQLVLFRVMQGLCGGPIMPMSQTLMLRVFPREKAGAALGLWAMTTVIAPILGPIFGGLISDNLSWHWIFFINLPIVAFCVTLAIRYLLPFAAPGQRAPIDVVGLLLLIVWVGSLQIMLDEGREADWFASPFIVTMAITAAVGFVAFLIWELTADHPIVDLSVFRYRGFSVGVAAQSIAYAAFFGQNVISPLFLQTNLGYTGTWAGLTMCYVGVLAVVLSPLASQMVGKVDVRLLISGGILWLGMIALIRTTWVTGTDYWTLAFPQMLQGAGMPFYFIGTTALILGSVPAVQTASASGLQNFLRTLSGAIATSVASTMWEHKTRYAHAELVGIATPPAASALPHFSAAQANMVYDTLIQSESVTLATDSVFLTCSGLFVIAAALVWLAPGRKGRAPAGGH